MTTFYRKTLAVSEDGLEVCTEEWISIHESYCFHFCVKNRIWYAGPTTLERIHSRAEREGITPLQAAKSWRYKVKRISKHSGRFAFPTEQEALEKLKFLKRRQLNHLTREAEFVNTFLERADHLVPVGENRWLVPDTKELVGRYFVFE